MGKVFAISVVLLLTGCGVIFDNTSLYDGTMPQPVQRWPDQVGMCTPVRAVLLPLHKVVTWTQLSTSPHYQYTSCGDAVVLSRVEFNNTDSLSIGGLMRVDGTGYGKGANVYYSFRLDKNKNFPPNVDYTPDWASYTSSSVNRRGRWQYNVPIPIKHKIFESNGLTWHHDLFVGFYSFSDDPDQPGIPAAVGDASFVELPYPAIKTPHQRELQWLGEVYTLKVDANHSMKIWASYSRPVTQDTHWLKARRAMLRQLVEAVTMVPLTPERLNALRKEEAKQSEIIKECDRQYPKMGERNWQCLREKKIQKGLK